MGFVKELINTNFLEYASYVIKDRAITDINDGLKPVQRRILHSLYEIDDGKLNKVANVVGNTMKYHPHGDASIFSALVVLANKELYLEKQGNFGNIFTGDEPSAPRYIECRLSELAKEVLFNPDLTEYTDSYDGRNKEPVTLPCKIPNLLAMGTEGIAVGMSTKVLPHNFKELLEAQVNILNKEKYAIYPDFFQGGLIDVSEYKKGNGKVRIRAVIEVKDNKTLLIKEIPFGTSTQSIISSIESAAKKGKVRVSSITDYTAEKVEIELKTSRGEEANDVLKTLYAYTDCEISVSVNLITLVNNKPCKLTVNEVLEYNTKKLVSDLKKELEIERDKLNEKHHYLTLEQLFIENRIYKKIEEIKTLEGIFSTIKKELNKYSSMFIRPLNEEDIERLLQLRIKRISRFDIENHRKEIDDIVKALKLNNQRLKDVKKFTIGYLEKLIEKYGEKYPRKTNIIKIDTISIRELAQQEDVKVYWDKNAGFLGTDVKADYYFTATPVDKFLVISNDFTYKFVSVDSKKFIDIKVAYINKFDPKRVFSLIYLDTKKNVYYAKKFRILKFVVNKIYSLAPNILGKIIYLSTGPNDVVNLHFEKKKGQKVKEKIFDFKDIEIKGASVRGNKVSSKRVVKVEKIK